MAQKKVKTPQDGGNVVVNDSVLVELSLPKRRTSRKTPSVKKATKMSGDIMSVENTVATTPAPVAKIKRARKKAETVQVDVASEETHTSIVPIMHNRLQLSLLSPFRFPIDHAALASQVARIAGVSFVIVGALFTGINMHVFDGTIARIMDTDQRATVTNYNCTDSASPNYNQDYCHAGTVSNIDTTPDVQVSVEGTTSLTNTIPVNVVVPLASRVLLYAFSENGGENIVLGDALKLDDLHWRYYWNTKQFQDGTYRLKAVITNAYGTYTEQKSTSYTLANTVSVSTGSNTESSSSTPGTSVNATSDATTTSSGTTSTENATTSISTVRKPAITLSIDERAPISDDVTLSVAVNEASRVVLYARPENTTTFKSIGEATRASNSEWRFNWVTTGYSDGGYTLKAQVTTGAGTFDGSFVTTAIKNTETKPATTTTIVEQQPILEPEVYLRIAEFPTVTEDAEIFVTVTNAKYVELYALPQKSLTPKFLGLAQKKSDTEWRYRWYSQQTPNGEYAVFARVGHAYGVTESARSAVRVENEVVMDYTPEQKKLLDEVDDTSTHLEKVTDVRTEEASTTTVPVLTVAPKASYVQPVDELVDEIDNLDESTRDEIADALDAFRETLDAELLHYARAIRIDDAEARESLIQKIETLKKELIESLPVGAERHEAIEKINTYVAEMIATLTELTARNEAVIKERIGDRAFLDTDKDGIADYDERNLYATNPFSADSDGDGFIDGTEIIKGYNPNSADAETLVTYESPRENGIVREDVFAVDTILTLTESPDETIADGVTTSALISGRGLPNSFVSLFIFSTPVVVTVKTDDEGAWSYIFDKELENGEHEIYVGVTDNAGRVVAKSNPLSFIKTAEAFTPVDAAQEEIVVVEAVSPSLVTDRMLLAVGSISVVGLGLVLLLLGLHVRRKADAQILRYP